MSKNYYSSENYDSGDFAAWLVGLLVGAMGGATLGLLMAPKSGRLLRAEIKEQARGIPDKMTELIDDSLDLYATGVNHAQMAVEKQTERMKRAVEAGKIAAAKKREELETGNSTSQPFQHN